MSYFAGEPMSWAGPGLGPVLELEPYAPALLLPSVGGLVIWLSNRRRGVFDDATVEDRYMAEAYP